MLIRIYTDSVLTTGIDCPLHAEAVHYLRMVMRQDVGSEIILFNGRGGEYRAEILSLQRNHGMCAIHEWIDIDRELGIKAFIIQSANRTDKIEHVLQKGTELGAAGFIICISDRMQLRLQGVKLKKRLERWQKIIIEAAEQSGRTYVPTLHWLGKLDALSPPPHPAFYLHPEASTTLDHHVATIQKAQAITFAVGPEGGWSGQDMAQLQQRGFQAMVFGKRIMRTETAAPALLASLQTIQDLP